MRLRLPHYAGLVVACLAGLPGAAGSASVTRDAKQVADAVLEALGGADAWMNTRFLRFDFGVERDGQFQGRAHTWDKWTGRYRLENTTPEGKKQVVLMNVNTREGSAYLDGTRLEGDAAAKALEGAYAAWINDTYWLLMPYKLQDPGVQLSSAGEDTIGGKRYDKLALSFENVGLTPKDKYWVWVNQETHMVDRWSYVLKGQDVAPTTWDWKGWQRKGRIMLAPERVNLEQGRKILFPVLEAPASVPDSAFTTP